MGWRNQKASDHWFHLTTFFECLSIIRKDEIYDRKNYITVGEFGCSLQCRWTPERNFHYYVNKIFFVVAHKPCAQGRFYFSILEYNNFHNLLDTSCGCINSLFSSSTTHCLCYDLNDAMKDCFFSQLAAVNFVTGHKLIDYNPS